MNDLILYTTEDGRSQIKLRAQLEMSELFDATKQNISLHLKNVFKDGELDEVSVVKDSLTTAADGKNYLTKIYSLDAILAVGYRVRSPRGVQFRRWAFWKQNVDQIITANGFPLLTHAGDISR